MSRKRTPAASCACATTEKGEPAAINQLGGGVGLLPLPLTFRPGTLEINDAQLRFAVLPEILRKDDLLQRAGAD